MNLIKSSTVGAITLGLAACLVFVAGCPFGPAGNGGIVPPPLPTPGEGRPVDGVAPFDAFLSASSNVLIRGDVSEGSATVTAQTSFCGTFQWAICKPDEDGADCGTPSGNDTLTVSAAAAQVLGVVLGPPGDTANESQITATVTGDPGPNGATIRVALVTQFDPALAGVGNCPAEPQGGAVDTAAQSLESTFPVRRPTGALAVSLSSPDGSTIAPQQSISLLARITGGRPFGVDDVVPCSSTGDFAPSNNGDPFCVDWAVNDETFGTFNALPITDAGGDTTARLEFTAPLGIGNILFTVSVTDQSGATVTSSIPVVVQSATPLRIEEALAAPTQIAPGGASSISVKGQGGTPPYTIAFDLLGQGTNKIGSLSNSSCSDTAESQACQTTYTADADKAGSDAVLVTITDAVGAQVSRNLPLVVAASQTLSVTAAPGTTVLQPGGTTEITSTITGGAPPYSVCFELRAPVLGALANLSGGCPIGTFSNCSCGVNPTAGASVAEVQRTYTAPGNGTGPVSVLVIVRDNVGDEVRTIIAMDVANTAGGGTGTNLQGASLSVQGGQDCLVADGASSITLDATRTGGNGDFEFTFSTTPANVGDFTSNPMTVSGTTASTTYTIDPADPELVGIDSVTVDVLVDPLAEANGNERTASVTINLLQNSDTTNNGTSAVCEGDALSVGLSAAVQAGMTCDWQSPGGTMFNGVCEPPGNATLADAGTWTFTRTRGACSISASHTLIVNPTPVANIVVSPGNEVCQGTTVNLDAGAGFASYAWDTGAATQAIDVTLPGTYCVTVTDASGCVSLQACETITVNNNPALNIAGTPDNNPDAAFVDVCVGDPPVTLDAGSGFVAPATYAWSTSESTQTINVTTPGTYTVTVTDGNGCMGLGSVELRVFANPTTTITATPSATVCAGTTVTLDGGAGFASYSWDTGATTRTIDVTASGTYCVTVTDANSCDSTQECIGVTVNPNPVPVITGVVDNDPSSAEIIDSCVGDTVTLDAGTFASHLWSTGATTQTIDVTVAATYSVTVTDGNTCVGNDDIQVVFNSLPTPSITASPSAVECAGTTVTLDAGAGFASYNWDTAETTQTIDVTVSGTYCVTVTDTNGCSSSQVCINVTINPNPDAVATNSTNDGVNPPAPACPGSVVNLIGNAGMANYAWSCTDGFTVSTAQNELVNDAGATQYMPTATAFCSLTVTDANGCTDTTTTGERTTVLVLPPTSVTLSVSPDDDVATVDQATVCLNSRFTFDAGAGFTNYEWTLDGSTIAGVSGQQMIVDLNAERSGSDDRGEYCVTVTSATGCQATDCLTLDVATDSAPAITGDLDNNPGTPEVLEICSGDTVQLDSGLGAGDLHTWFLDGVVIGGETAQTLNATASGEYCVQVDRTTCSGFDCITVTVNSNPSTTPTITPPADNDPGTADIDVCVADGSFALQVVETFGTYEWSKDGGVIAGETADTLTISAISTTDTGQYCVIGIDANGCRSPQACVDMTVNTNPVAVAFNSTNDGVNPPAPACPGDTVNLIGPAGMALYAWSCSDGFTTTTTMPNLTDDVGATQYTPAATAFCALTVTDANGCTDTTADADRTTVIVLPSCP